MLTSLAPHLSKVTIWLASQSPRRRQILEMVSLEFRVRPSSFAEDLDKSEYVNRPYDYVLATAEQKARHICEEITNDARTDSNTQLVIACDTVVTLDGEIIEKPNDKQHAFEMLKRLNNRTHTVYTGVIVMRCFAKDKQKPVELCERFCSNARVTVADNSDAALRWYADSGVGLDKAGAYGIQDAGGMLIKSIDGDFYTIMGLPLHELMQKLLNKSYSYD